MCTGDVATATSSVAVFYSLAVSRGKMLASIIWSNNQNGSRIHEWWGFLTCHCRFLRKGWRFPTGDVKSSRPGLRETDR